MHPFPALRPLLILAALIGGTATAAPEPPAAAVAVVKLTSGSVEIERGAQKLPATVGMPLLLSDTVVTGRDGSAGLTFEDNCLLSLGPGSRLAIDTFSFNSTTHDGSFETTLSQGRMAVVSGKIAKHQVDAMKVRTPTSLLGVRGTEFIVEAGE